MILPIKQMHFPDHANLYFIPVDNIHFVQTLCYNTLYTKHQIVLC